jgi:hypothetical protein
MVYKFLYCIMIEIVFTWFINICFKIYSKCVYFCTQEPNLDFKTTTTLKNYRKKRSTVLNCNEENQFDTCCRYPLTVDFVEFGWDFVIAPQRYDAYYCAGECRNEGLSESGHSAVVQHIPESRIIGTHPGPCCSPVRMANLKMLYFDHNSRVQLTTLPRMKVVRCGCT